MSFQEGEGEHTSIEPEGRYQVVRGREIEITRCLARYGLDVDWKSTFNGKEGDWITMIAQRATLDV